MACTVFVSYAGIDRDHAVELAAGLGSEGVSALVDATALQPGDRWDVTLADALRHARMIVVLLSPSWKRHDAWYAHDEIARAIARARDESDRVRVVPVVMGAVSALDMPSGLARLVPLVHRGPGWKQTASMLAGLLVGEWSAEAPPPGSRTCVGPRLSLSRLPTSGRDFVGRTPELALLDAAWRDPHMHLQTIIGVGGEGKTALIHRWLRCLALDDYGGAARVYAWSFYSQGAGEDRQSSAELFIDQLLRWLDDPHPEQGDPWQKGARLAALIREQKTLLVLDGVEPLQHPPGESAGRLKDPALRVLLSELAARMNGLCVVTSRLPLADIPPGGPIAEHRLPPLDPLNGAALLRARGVRGEPSELEQASQELKGHALALHLLGGYLRVYEQADVRRRDRVPDLRQARDGGAHARRVLDAYNRWLTKAAIAALRIVGLFDRAAESSTLAAILAAPAIHGLTDYFDGLDDPRWLEAVDDLRTAGLLLPGESTDVLDAHPLVREHFGDALRTAAPTAWVEAHTRLYVHFAGTAPAFPDDFSGLEPLYRAVYHGCAAGRYHEALDVFRLRVRRQDAHYSSKKLGTFSTDLATLSAFYERPWSRVRAELEPSQGTWLLGVTGYALRAMGRLPESVGVLAMALERRIEERAWRGAAINAGNLSLLLLALGRLEPDTRCMPSLLHEDASTFGTQGAVALGRMAVELADRSKDPFQRMARRTTLATVLHHRGRLRAARRLFAESERLQHAIPPRIPWLYSIRGYRYGELLLNEDSEQARLRAKAMLDASSDSLLGFALGYLLLGRAMHYSAQDGDKTAQVSAQRTLNEAVDRLRHAGRADFIPPGLLARAALNRSLGEWSAAERDIEEARDIAERGSMRLLVADVHLEAARLAVARAAHQTAVASYRAACDMIYDAAYHLRDHELAHLAAALHVQPPDWLGRADIMVDLPPTLSPDPCDRR